MLVPITLTDLAGPLDFQPHYWQTQTRIRHLITQYLSNPQLKRHLEELPQQFNDPKPRPWQRIHWQDIDRHQIIGIKPDIFLSILMGAIETEAPIRRYTQTSRQYLHPIHPQMAQYVGGQLTEAGMVIEPGLWEKEERQHTPALLKIYHQLTGSKAKFEFRTVRDYYPSENPKADLYHHGIHRISTEYSAVCLYLWMMARTTGPLQQVFSELVKDEINHMTKFWGFGLWLFPETHFTRTTHIFSHLLNVQRFSASNLSSHRLLRTIRRMMGVLGWQNWPFLHKTELAAIFVQVLYRIHQWSRQLSPNDLNNLLGQSPIQAKD